jgi:hypothetical protein
MVPPTPTRRGTKRKSYTPRRFMAKKSARRRLNQPMRYGYRLREKINESEAVTRGLRTVAETKVKTMTDYNEQPNIQTQAGSIATMTNYVVGGVPTQYTSFLGLQGVPAPGTGADQFIGRSFYWKHSTVFMRLTTNAVQSPIPMRFRCVVYKPRRIAMQAGFTNDPTTALFQDTTGNFVGASTAGVTGTDLMTLNINKRTFDVQRDFTFTLQPPGIAPQNDQPRPLIQGVYPCDKMLKFYLPIERKLFKEDSRPDFIGVGHHWCISIFADTVTRDGLADNWETSVRGSTIFLDM